jgi:predicted Zn-dependent protease
MNQWFLKHPEDFKSYQDAVRKTLTHSTNMGDRNDVRYTIPVVFHILHQGGNENISDAQIHDQIRILNRDYQKQNADTANIVSAFKALIADVGFAFELAKIDPNGDCTDGIVRHYTTKTNWDANNLNDFIYSWPRDKYLNFYVVKSINIAATAYTFLPGVPIPPSADAIVTLHNMVGSVGTSSNGTSRVLTHEVGHWFGLPHIWGISNAPGVECGDDFVADTPITKGFTTCSINNAKICNSSITENVQNYMDYSPCKIMFTKGQSDYMHGTILSTINGRDNLVSEANLEATGLIGNRPCSLKAEFSHFEKNICVGDSIEFSSQSEWRDSNTTLIWKINQQFITSHETNEKITITFDTVGSYVVSLILNSGSQIDSFESTIIVQDGNNGIEAPFAYAFADDVPLDLNVTDVQEDNITWLHNPDQGALLTKGSIYLPYYNNLTIGSQDYFETPYFDFSTNDKPGLTYYYAYAKAYQDQVDSFRIEYTTDCGETWKKLPTVPTIQTMATKSGGYQSDAFFPSASQWVKANLSSAFRFIAKNKPSIKLRFYFKADENYDFANNFYLDEINILNEGISSTSQFDDTSITLSPNPTSDQTTLTIEGITQPKNLSISLCDLTGRSCGEILPNDMAEGSMRYKINVHELASGIYFVKIKDQERKCIVKKLVIE